MKKLLQKIKDTYQKIKLVTFQIFCAVKCWWTMKKIERMMGENCKGFIGEVVTV
jgi:hypothetical protein